MWFIVSLQFRKKYSNLECVSVAENTDDDSDYLTATLFMSIDELNNKRIRDSMHGEGLEDEILSELNTETI